MLKFAYDPNKPSKSNGKYLFGILYARMEPVRAHFELPATKKADKIGESISAMPKEGGGGGKGAAAPLALFQVGPKRQKIPCLIQ